MGSICRHWLLKQEDLTDKVLLWIMGLEFRRLKSSFYPATLKKAFYEVRRTTGQKCIQGSGIIQKQGLNHT